MAIEVDVRGYSCPVPVVKTKKAMEENPGKELKVTADNKTACDNITRLAKNSGYSCEITTTGSNDYELALKPGK